MVIGKASVWAPPAPHRITAQKNANAQVHQLRMDNSRSASTSSLSPPRKPTLLHALIFQLNLGIQPQDQEQASQCTKCFEMKDPCCVHLNINMSSSIHQKLCRAALSSPHLCFLPSPLPCFWLFLPPLVLLLFLSPMPLSPSSFCPSPPHLPASFPLPQRQ